MGLPDAAGARGHGSGGAGPWTEDEQAEVGYEKDRLGGDPSSPNIRWWFYLWVPGDRARNQQARLGVPDNGFRFARGGRASTADEAHERLAEAQDEAQREIAYWRGQPSHALGPNGELIPLDQLPELPA